MALNPFFTYTEMFEIPGKNVLTHFMLLFLSVPSENTRKKPFGFVMLSGDIERDQLHEMG